jgi:hypothetical protein
MLPDAAVIAADECALVLRVVVAADTANLFVIVVIVLFCLCWF